MDLSSLPPTPVLTINSTSRNVAMTTYGRKIVITHALVLHRQLTGSWMDHRQSDKQQRRGRDVASYFDLRYHIERLGSNSWALSGCLTGSVVSSGWWVLVRWQRHHVRRLCAIAFLHIREMTFLGPRFVPAVVSLTTMKRNTVRTFVNGGPTVETRKPSRPW